MHVRRALLLFALVLGLTALATAIAPAPPPPDEPTVATPPTRPPVEPETTFAFQAPPPRRGGVEQRVAPDAHVVVEVVSAEGGQATIPKLGRLETVSDGAPARFDLLDLAVGRYDVLFEPALGEPVRIGTIVSAG